MNDMSDISAQEAQSRIELIDYEIHLAAIKAKAIELYNTRRIRGALLKRLTLSGMLVATVSTHIALMALELYNHDNSEKGDAVVKLRHHSAKTERTNNMIKAINAGTMKADTPKILKGLVQIELPDAQDIRNYG